MMVCEVKRFTFPLLAVLAACRAPVAPGVESYVPPGTVAVAAVDIAALRGSPLYPKIAPLLPASPDARSLWLAYRGSELLMIADGKLTGPADLIQAAEAQHLSGKPGEPELLSHAPLGGQIWMVVRGGVALPLTGNYANVNRLLRDMEYATVSLRAGSPVEVALTARGRTPEAARHFEQTFRATLTLIAAGESKNAELASLLRSIQVRRTDRDVTSNFTLSPDDVGKLIR
jgi:hypothetical protein